MDSLEDASSYDAMDHSGPNAAFVARLRELDARGQMLDIGTGPGHIPLLVCDAIEAARVTAVDLSRHMLAFADAKLAASPHRGRIEFRVADAKALPFADGAFDTVFSNTILHHLHDPRPMLREAWRVLRPGGALLIRDLYRPDTAARVDALTARYAGTAPPHARELFRASLHAAFTVDEMRAMLRALGLGDGLVVVDTDRHMSIQRGSKCEVQSSR